MSRGFAAVDAPEVGELVQVRGQQWVVNRRSVSAQPRDELAPDLPGRTLVTLTSVSDEDPGDDLTVVWEIETLSPSARFESLDLLPEENYRCAGYTP